MKYIDRFLNNTTMYRLVLYGLLFLVSVAIVLGFLGKVPYSGFSIILSALFIGTVCFLVNWGFAKTFQIPSNVESSAITALILTLIATPISSIESLPFLFWLSVLSITSKYIVVFWNKHFFNPVAFAAVVMSFTTGQSISWWVGNYWMALPVLMVGFLVVRKIRRWDLVLTFFVVALLTAVALGLPRGTQPLDIIQSSLVYSPLLFFAFIMLTEPLTTPPTRNLRLGYATIAGLLVSPQSHIGNLFFTPELALLVANIFSYVVSPKKKLVLKLERIEKLAKDTYDFIFSASNKLKFSSGQYLEWTLGHYHPDSRGNRRYFTIASSPTEKLFRLGVKFNKPSSSFKKKLKELKVGDKILAGQLAGDFTLPSNQKEKLVMIAGGIGVTPFRSMVQYLVDTNQRRDVVMFYANNKAEDIAYQDFFSQAEKSIGLKMHYVLTDKESVPANWHGEVGFLNEAMVKKSVPDYLERTFYLSGPNAMVNAYKGLLLKMGVKRQKIITDYFPGFA